MEFNENGFSIEKDLDKICAMSEGKLTSFGAKKPMGEQYRVYLVEPPDIPIAIFDKVPCDLLTVIFANRRLYLSDTSSSSLIRLAIIRDDDCQSVGSITLPAAIWASVLLAPYCRNDFHQLHENAFAVLNRTSSANQ